MGDTAESDGRGATPLAVGGPRFAARAILAQPGVLYAVAAALAGRVAIAMTPVSVVLLVRSQAASYATAGACAAAFTAGAALGAPLRGRLTDGHGQPAVLLPCAAVFGGGLGALVATALAGAPTAILMACAATAGVAFPPLAACVNLVWPDALPAELVEPAYAFDAICEELSFLIGALAVSLLVTLASPVVALLSAAALGAFGTAAYAAGALARGWRPSAPIRARRWAFNVAGVRTIVAQATLSGVSFGALEVGVVVFSETHATRSAAGLLLAVISVGSLLGGVWFSARAGTLDEASLVRYYLGLLAVSAISSVALPLAHSIAAVVPALVAVGFCVAPLMACLYLILRRLAPAGAIAEAYAWIITAVYGGVAIGAALAGVLAEHVGAGALYAVVAAAVLAAIVPALLRRTLWPEGPGTVAEISPRDR